MILKRRAPTQIGREPAKCGHVPCLIAALPCQEFVDAPTMEVCDGILDLVCDGLWTDRASWPTGNASASI